VGPFTDSNINSIASLDISHRRETYFKRPTKNYLKKTF